MIFDALSLSDVSNYLVEEVTYRSMPKRDIVTGNIATRAGERFIVSEWRSKMIEVKGRIFGANVDSLRSNIDDFQRVLAVEQLNLFIDPDRYYVATLDSLDIPTQFYNATMVSYDAKFYCADPFAYTSYTSVAGVTASGIVTYSGSVTISGTVYAEPALTITPLGNGDSGLRSISVTHNYTGESVTISGTLHGSVPIIFDYKNFLVTVSGLNYDYVGIFARWEPWMVNEFTITTTGLGAQGYTWGLGYDPRYYG